MDDEIIKAFRRGFQKEANMAGQVGSAIKGAWDTTMDSIPGIAAMRNMGDTVRQVRNSAENLNNASQNANRVTENANRVTESIDEQVQEVGESAATAVDNLGWGGLLLGGGIGAAPAGWGLSEVIDSLKD